MKHTSRILAKGDTCCRGASPFYLVYEKRIPTDHSPWDSSCANMQHARWHTYVQVCVPMDTCGPGARSTVWSTSCLTSSKHLDYHGFKNW
jgi:hypothetical protein